MKTATTSAIPSVSNTEATRFLVTWTNGKRQAFATREALRAEILETYEDAFLLDGQLFADVVDSYGVGFESAVVGHVLDQVTGLPPFMSGSL